MRHSRLIETFLELIKIDSESKNERAVCDYLKGKFAPFTSEITEDDTSEKIGGNCGNLFVRIKGDAAGAPSLLLNAHMDTVKPGTCIEPVIEDDIIRSAGGTVLGGDDKAGLAVIIEAVTRLGEKQIPHGDLLLAITVAEEIGLLGARNAAPALFAADFGLSLDCPGPAGLVYNAAPAHDTLIVKIFGRSAHAGMEPEKGINAIQVASRAIARMNIGRIDDETTSNVGVIKGGRATNIVPDSVVIDAEARSHNPQKLEKQIADMRSAVERAASEFGARFEIELKHEYRQYKIDADSPVIRATCTAASELCIDPVIKAAGGGSDANIFNEHGVPTIPIGTAMRNCHTTDEEISISELETISEWVLKIIESVKDL